VSIHLRIPPDLRVTSVAIPEHTTAGQFFNLTYTVSNLGGGDTPTTQGAWTDEFYLSRDQVLDLRADRYLGSQAHSGGLAAGDSYSSTISLRVPRDISGAFYVFAVTDPARGAGQGSVFEADKEGNNAGHSVQPLLIELPPPSDLRVDSISPPAAAQSGDTITINWTASNHGQNSADVSWTDAAYLSSDNVWDLGD